MKKAAVVTASIAVALILIGGAMTALAYAVSGGDIGVRWNPRGGFVRAERGTFFSGETQSDAVETGSFSSLSVKTDMVDVILKPGERESVEYVCPAEYPRPTVEVVNGELVVKICYLEQGSVNLFGVTLPKSGIGTNRMPNSYVIITYPQGVRLDRAKLESGMADISVSGMDVSGKLTVQSDMGECTIKQTTAGEMDLSADMGSVQAENVETERFTAESNMGDIQLNRCSLGQAEIDSDVGSVEGRDLVIRGLKANSDLGGISLSGDIGGDVEVAADIGSVELKTTQPRSQFHLILSRDVGSTKVDGREVRDGWEENQGAPWRMELSGSMGSVSVNFGS